MPAGRGQIIWDVAVEEVTNRTDSTHVAKQATILITGAKKLWKIFTIATVFESR